MGIAHPRPGQRIPFDMQSDHTVNRVNSEMQGRSVTGLNHNGGADTIDRAVVFYLPGLRKGAGR
jgi:hypothetical protein